MHLSIVIIGLTIAFILQNNNDSMIEIKWQGTLFALGISQEKQDMAMKELGQKDRNIVNRIIKLS